MIRLEDRVAFNPRNEIVRCWTTKLRGFILAHQLLAVCGLVRNLEVPFTELGILGETSKPVSDLLLSQEGQGKMATIHDAAPEACMYCVDKMANIAFENISDVLDSNSEAVFERANVKSSNSTQKGVVNNHVQQVDLDLKDFNSFSEGKVVEF